MMRGKGLAVVMAAALGMGTLLAGCGSDEPTEEPQRSAQEKPEKEPEPEPSEPTIEEQQDEAIAAVKKFLDASNKARRTLEPKAFLALSDPGCESCEFYAKELRRLDKEGGVYEGDFVEEFVGADPKDSSKVSPLLVTVRHGDWQITNGGKTEAMAQAGEYTTEYQMKQVEGKWVVAEMIAESE